MKVGFKRFLSYLISIVLVAPMFLWGSSIAMANGIDISVTDANGGVFKIGDIVSVVVTATAGQVTQVDFTDFGGSTILAEESATPGQYLAEFQIAPGSIDSTAFVWARVDGGEWTKDDLSFTVDNIAPPITGQGALNINKNNSGDVLTLGIGDYLTFNQGTLDIADGENWTVNLAVPNNITGDSVLTMGSNSSNAIENNITGDFNFVVTGTDNAGNMSQIDQGTNFISIDTKRPTLTGANTESTDIILARFSEELDLATVGIGDFAISDPATIVITATLDSPEIVEIAVAPALSSDATPTLAVTNDGGDIIRDIAGNTIALPSSTVAEDGIAPERPQITDPLLPTVINADVTIIEGNATAGSVVKIYTDPNNDGDRADGIMVKEGLADQDGNFALSVSLTQDQDNSFLATASDSVGNESPATDVPTITEDSSVITPSHFGVNQNGDYIDLSWSASDDAIGYEIWRSSSPYQLIATVDSSTLSYTDKTVTKGIKYYYKVIAVDALGNRSESAELSFMVPTEIIASTSSGSVPIVTAALTETVQSVEVPNEVINSVPSANVVRVTPTPEPSVTPEVKGVQEEQKGESWWPLIIPIALVLLAGAIVPLSASTAISMPIIGAVLALILSAYTSGDIKSSYMYLMLGGETIILLLVNYGLLAGSTENDLAEVATLEEEKEEKPSKRKSKKSRKRK